MSALHRSMPDHVWAKKIEILKAESKRLSSLEAFSIKDIDAVRVLVFEAQELGLSYEYWGELDKRIHANRHPDAGIVITGRR